MLEGSKVLWTGGLLLSGLCLAPFFTTLPAIFVGLGLTYITLLLGHSVGMHRMMIHRSFETPTGLRYILLYLGTLVGIGGPSSVIEIHDTRDWAQRAPDCHDFFSHTRGFWRDLSWHLFYRFDFDHPPHVTIEPQISEDLFLQHLDQHWRWHQLGLTFALYLIGGIPFVVWGVCLRVVISTAGHWTVTYFCHNPGPGKWDVRGAGVQASNLKLPGLIGGWLTHGECWHNNHHAFPESAQIGLEQGQVDPAWFVISKLEKLGLAYHVRHPRKDTVDLKPRTV
jgi:stearoyl-CoA desaturase (delta-9 desaturase)